MTFPEPGGYLAFIVASIVILLIPGPAVLYIVTRSIDQGRVAGVVSALGAGVGNFVHVIAAVVGLSSLIAASALAFTIVKWAGVIYLMWLGVSRFRQGERVIDIDKPEPAPRSRIFRQGVIVNILNPKVALFFLAFLPQFADPARGPIWQQVFILGTTFVLIGICTDSLYGLAAGSIGNLLKRSRRARKAERYVASGTYIALGVAGAATGSPE